MLTTIRSAGRALADRPAGLRWLGFAGSALLSAGAYVGGAFPTMVPNVNPITVFERPEGPLIYVLWFFGTVSLVSAWVLGRRHIGRGVLRPSWVLVTAALWILPMLVCPPTGSRDVYAYSCQGALMAAGHSPYVEGVSALPCPWLDSVSLIWRSTPAPYGPLFLMLAGIGAKLGSQTAAVAYFRVLAVIGVAAIAVLLPALARRRGVPADRALWLVLCCPLVVVDMVGGAHNDALTIAFLVAGLVVLSMRPTGAATSTGAATPAGGAIPTGGARPSAGPIGGAGAGERLPGYGALIVGGVLVGLSIAMKTTLGVALPFAALVAAGGPNLPGLKVVLQRGATVMAAGLGTLLALSYASGLGFGWIKALSHAGDSIAWTSPPTAVGLAVGYLVRPFGLHPHAESVTRLIALIVMPIVLALILWHSRNHDPLYGAGLAMLATIFLAPIVQPWYLIWPLTMFAVTRARIRWFLIAVLVGSSMLLPDGSGFTKFAQLPGSFVMSGIVVWTVVRGFGWLRGYEPKEIDFEALRASRARPAEAAAPASPAPAAPVAANP